MKLMTKREDMAGDWSRVHNEELRNLYISPYVVYVIKSKRMGCAVCVVCIGNMRNAYKILIRNTEGKRPLGRPGHKREDNIKVDLMETGCESLE
jgi:hypothetical protein